MKLQKLVYYSQAWSLAWRGEPLFRDEIEAWAAGPVVRALYNKHRGMFSVSESDFAGFTAALSDADKHTVNVVVEHYGKFTAEQLSDLTHAELPWQEARKGLAPTARGERVIELAHMADYYGALARQARTQHSA